MLGTAVFAVEGAQAAIVGGLDALGVLVLAFVTALGGGIVRDLLIGDVPPASMRDWRYAAVAIAGGAGTFLAHLTGRPMTVEFLIDLDAAGLGLFAVAGAQKTLEYGLPPLVAVLMGGLTAVGGGVIRDVLLARIPLVLHADVYATAALAGALAMIVARKCGLGQPSASACGATACFALRMVAVAHHWNLR